MKRFEPYFFLFIFCLHCKHVNLWDFSNGLFVKRAMIDNITGFMQGLLVAIGWYFNSVTIAYYSILLVGLCHYKVVFYIEVWCYPYPPGYQIVTQNGFTLAARPIIFHIFPKRFTFFVHICKHVYLFYFYN